MAPIQRAIIIGGGPAGLAAAIRLKTHNGIDTVVYEIRPEPTTLGGAVNIPSNGLRLFDRLGLYDKLVSLASSASQLIVHSRQGTVLADLDLAGWSRDQVGYGFMRVLRRDLIEVLLEETTKQNVPVIFGKSVTKIVETESQATVTFADGTTDTADLLLGCDGIHSAVRSLHVSPNAAPEYTGIANMFTILPVSELSEANRELAPALHATLTRQGLFGVMPCTASGSHLYWFYSRQVPLPSGDSREGWETYNKQQVAGFKENLESVFADATGHWSDQLREMVQKTDTIKFYPLYKMPPDIKWFTKRSLILGDAAHAMQPHAGQGTSMALEDVFLLSRLLEQPSRPLPEVFEKYQAIRRPRVEAIANASASNGEIRKDTGPIALKVKEFTFWGLFSMYKMVGLQKWGIGMNQKDTVYDIMAEPI
ncbi:related to 2-polyprenyl-6-methoxyphenol hydroxylase and related FAD-dependent oxidoreductases [Fusarium mangiferae]|uniref:Related to 2-polyprenyl-6-methoxyphenol hydroxylase and related FAD-dependent oxidoreductases n=1 Tax=Fusarium mangiferae TaxID=192010 RepID=A0A1L7TY99_FUSMA|nr:related to 2-polyprenyl-6-methoxyphenol hydroxylase and related FAD-dependent oxidoreductases [Fusarium mangiferae]CVL00357.1 related to 2-polyprenyl-6-methoxyphenol hydroxylase and related FAD-dependent oxidoreductases [Fusarium mangiferae]